METPEGETYLPQKCWMPCGCRSPHWSLDDNDNLMTTTIISYHLGHTESMSKVVKRSCIVIPENLK